MIIEEIVQKLINTEKRISKEKGEDFNFFGAFKRMDLENSWDIVISANWFSKNKRKDLIYIINEIKKDLKDEELMFLARIVLIKPEDKLIRELNKVIKIEHGMTEMIDNQINEIRLKHAYIITSKK